MDNDNPRTGHVLVDHDGGRQMKKLNKKTRVTLESTRQQKETKREHIIETGIWCFSLVIVLLGLLIVAAFIYSFLLGG